MGHRSRMLLGIVSLIGLVFGFAPAAQGAPVDDFDPGYIVSDDSFFNEDSMTADDVQAFLDGLTCRPSDGVPCVADYVETTRSQPEQGAAHCDAYQGGYRESAAEIISKVATACHINPQTLLVLLQKEQSLLTRPSASGYLRATGYGCPDTADCDTKYFGFFNQVYNAAWQFRQYTAEPDRTYQVGSVPVQFHPNAACGSTTIDIKNQATANLYNYTPYQPNSSALADPDGDGDECSAWGNLNFQIIWNDWFDDSTTQRLPEFFPACERHVAGASCRDAGSWSDYLFNR